MGWEWAIRGMTAGGFGVGCPGICGTLSTMAIWILTLCLLFEYSKDFMGLNMLIHNFHTVVMRFILNLEEIKKHI